MCLFEAVRCPGRSMGLPPRLEDAFLQWTEYLVGYVPTNPSHDGKYRQVRVSLIVPSEMTTPGTRGIERSELPTETE